jgi:hypothetical protein
MKSKVTFASCIILMMFCSPSSVLADEAPLKTGPATSVGLAIFALYPAIVYQQWFGRLGFRAAVGAMYIPMMGSGYIVGGQLLFLIWEADVRNPLHLMVYGFGGLFHAGNLVPIVPKSLAVVLGPGASIDLRPLLLYLDAGLGVAYSLQLKSASFGALPLFQAGLLWQF